jgi:hypothetical protein
MFPVSLRRLAGTALASLALLTAACGGDSDSTGPSRPGGRCRPARKEDRMTEAVRAAWWPVAGRYDLMGVNGSLLPALLDADAGGGAAGTTGAGIIAGELRLEPGGDYRLSLTARFDTAGGDRFTQVLTSHGGWRYLASALDPTSGEVLLTGSDAQVTSAAVTGVSLVHRTRGLHEGRDPREANWIYVRHWQTP